MILKQQSDLPGDSDRISPEIDVQGLSRTYEVGGQKVLALRGVDLTVQRGEFVGVVGVSGSGKSTLLHLIGGLDSPDIGEITVAGRDLRKLNAFQKSLYRRQATGFVFQSFYLVPNLTALQNVRLALTLQGVYGRDRERRAMDAIERVGMSHRANHHPGQLSGGEQQRITVARAIANRPRVLLADEPTGNLDQSTARSLMQLLDEIRREAEMTILMVTHDEPLARDFCDRLLRMSDGSLAD